MKKYHLFEVFGIELEYMLVNKKSLKVASQVDELLSLKQGEITSDVENGEIAWSNELVAHVVELKTNGPTKDLAGLSEHFHENVVESVSSLFNEKIVQVALVGGVLFYLLANDQVFNFVAGLLKKVGQSIGMTINLEGNNLVMFHSLVFAALLGLSIQYIFKPLFYSKNGLFRG